MNDFNLNKPTLTQERLKYLLFYKRETGDFIRTKPAGGQAIGAIAGRLSVAGYIDISIDGKRYKAHRLAWMYEYGYFPICEIDHINRVKNDNSINNLRLATHQLNMENTGLKSSNTSGYAGVDFKNNKWRARIQTGGKSIHLGAFESVNDAIKARLTAQNELHHYAPTV